MHPTHATYVAGGSAINAKQRVVLRPVEHLLHPVDEGRHSEEGLSKMGSLGGHALDVHSQS
jgi:hypothetical protein